MDILTAAEVRELALIQQSPCVSLFMPTHRRGSDTRQDPIRFKNLLNRLEEQLQATGMRHPEARDFIGRARPLTSDTPFWQHQADGLALFMWDGQIRVFRLPLRFNELACVGKRFHLKPLFPLLVGDGLFYVLAISQNQLRLLRCTRDSFEIVDSPLLPRSEEVILQYVQNEKHFQWHTEASPAPGAKRRDAVFHGQGAVERDYKDRIYEYFRLVAVGLRKLIGDVRVPIVFAGVDYLFPIFQDANDGLNLLDDFIAGSPDEREGRGNVRPDELHRSAWSIIEPYLIQQRDRIAGLYREAAGKAPERIADSVDDAVRAAHDGRVEYLFVPRDAQVWGRFDSQTCRVEFHDQQQPGDEDLLDFATVHTFIYRGTVYAVDRSEMPAQGKSIAAVLRY
jgi:hypothetical protein